MDSDAILTPPTPQELRDAASVLERYNAPDGGREITREALDSAAYLIKIVDDEPRLAGVSLFPMENGGVHVEWSSSSRVTSFEISPNGVFEFFDVDIASNAHSEETTSSPARARELLDGVLIHAPVVFAQGGDGCTSGRTLVTNPAGS